MRTNLDRGVAAFNQIAGYGESWDYTSSPGIEMHQDDLDMLAQQMSDLLCDMHHLADIAELSWDELLSRGDYHYQAEIQDAKEGLA